MTAWFWETPEWQRYALAWNPDVSTPVNFGALGNLVVRLDEPSVMRHHISKGHRSNIVQGSRALACSVLYGGNYPRHFDAFRELHALDAGRVTRSNETWAIQQEWVRDGYAMVTFVGEPPDMIAASLWLLYGNGSYYSTVAKTPEAEKRHAGHLMVWTAMNWLSEAGYEWLDLGPIDPNADEKVKAIESFKKHFGAETRTWPYE